MTETPVLFGPDSSLVGVLTQPSTGEPTGVAFVTFNAGLISRIGPHRLNVKLARGLAQCGVTSLRFDLSGQGDSRNVATGGDHWSQAIRDLGCAMDHLEQVFGIHHFALIGICSGAVSAFATAKVDPRVVGVLMFDGHWYRTRWTRPMRHWRRLRAASWGSLVSAAKRRLAGLIAPRSAATAKVAIGGDTTPPNPPRAEFIRSLQSLVDRRVAVFFMYSCSAIDYYSYANQFRDAFRREAFVDKVRSDFCPDIDHTLISITAQRRMIETVKAWVPEVLVAYKPSAQAAGQLAAIINPTCPPEVGTHARSS